MLITRTPLRITLGGGGTDLPAYYETSGEGFLIAAAISKYVYVAVHDNFADRYLIKYSRIEDVNFAHEVSHPIVREALLGLKIAPGLEITSFADIPAGTGLGSSGAFTVGLLKALHQRAHQSPTNFEIAEEACRIEIEKLGEPVGKQDQFICALGGLTTLTFRNGGEVVAEALDLNPLVSEDLEDRLQLFFTGVRRRAVDELSALHEGADLSDQSIRKNLDAIRTIGYESATALRNGDLGWFGHLMSEQWRLKFERSPSSLHQQVDQWLQHARRAGALGGKLVGAGGGGFLLILSEQTASVRQAMTELGLREVPFTFDHLGASVVI
jgi:D-glycero-alpha-D-manno-heptose-7-phosphate kinase